MSHLNITPYFCTDPDHEQARYAPFVFIFSPYSAGRPTPGVARVQRFRFYDRAVTEFLYWDNGSEGTPRGLVLDRS